MFVRYKVPFCALAIVFGLGSVVHAAEPAPPARLTWMTDYSQAMEKAKADKKMLLILFQNNSAKNGADLYETKYLPAQAKALQSFVIVKLPVDVTVPVQGKPTRLLSHAAFTTMHNSPGIAIIDYANVGDAGYSYVVSQFPFARGKYYEFRPEHLPVVLTLPSGTLTQRTMVYAVRVHPEGPASTQGSLHPVLADEAQSHSNYQANLKVQGHHQWDSRFKRILGRLVGAGTRSSGYPSEVCAESWPNQDLLDSCVDCVASWRQSSGHWAAVKGYHSTYGYDIRQGTNGIWYATGIFAN